ncbi:MAG: D-cysteine desulfhydrase family protein [Bacteroidota bacterium]|nr:D-cysteine desulfhydrase family protein [Bacteroidota bacterium]
MQEVVYLGMINKSRKLFDMLPRLLLAPLETSVQELKFFHELFPSCPRIFIKRDDFIGPLVWGNKLRKLEYTLAEAQRQGADTLITTGGMQSNHARTTAQVARQEGFDVILVLNGKAPEKARGNYLINKKLGVKIYAVPDRTDRIPKMKEIANNLIAEGKKPFIVPLGASDEFGTLGFVKASQELRLQEEQLGCSFDYILHASSSGGTQGGLILGKQLFGLNAKIIGISVDSSPEELSASIHQATDPIIDKLQLPISIHKDDIHVDTGYIGTGYGIPTEDSLNAEKLLAEKAGILLDQTYSAKAMSGLIDYIKKGFFKPKDKVLFWHTGGTIALFQ